MPVVKREIGHHMDSLYCPPFGNYGAFVVIICTRQSSITKCLAQKLDFCTVKSRTFYADDVVIECIMR